TMISLFALTAMTNEGVGTVVALRRGTVLLRAGWAEGRLTTLGLGLLWLPLVIAEGAAYRSFDLDPRSGLTVLYLFAALNFTIWSVLWLLERVYVAAVYCYAVEGVVPGRF